MGHATARTRLTRRVTLISALICATAVIVAPSVRAAGRPDIRTLELSLTGGAATRAALSLDSDGDGWSDWAERLNGTDPKNPASHPLRSTVEIVGTTAYVQSVSFPDKLAVISLALPETTIPGSSLLPNVTGLAGITEDSKLSAQLKQMLGTLYDGGVLATLMASLDKGQASLPNFGSHTNGMDVTLIAGADVISWEQWKKIQEAAEFVRNNDVSIGTTTSGDPYIEVRNSEGVQTHVLGGDGSVSSWLINTVAQDDNSSVMFWTHLTNGEIDSYGKKVTHADGSTEYWDYDANGNETAHGTTPARGASPANTNQPAPTTQPTQPAATATATATATGKATGEPTSTATSSSSYSNPDADPYLVPTQKEIAERVAFLTGVRVHTIENPPTISSTLVPKPGVTDPADPACDKARCVFFYEASSPDLHRTAGGDPVPPDLADRRPPLR